MCLEATFPPSNAVKLECRIESSVTQTVLTVFFVFPSCRVQLLLKPSNNKSVLPLKEAENIIKPGNNEQVLHRALGSCVTLYDPPPVHHLFFFFTSLHNGVCEGGDDITPRPNVNLYILYFITFILMYSQLKSNDKKSCNPKNMLKILTPIKL